MAFKKNGWTASLSLSWLIAVLTAAVAMNARKPCFVPSDGGVCGGFGTGWSRNRLFERGGDTAEVEVNLVVLLVAEDATRLWS